MAEASQNLVGRKLTLSVRPTPYRCIYAGKRKKNLSETFRLWLVGMIVVAAMTVFMVFASVYASEAEKHWTVWLPLVNVLVTYRMFRRRCDMLSGGSSRTPSPAVRYLAAREVSVYPSLAMLLFGMLTSSNLNSRSDAQEPLVLVVVLCLLSFFIVVIAGLAIAEGQAMYRKHLVRRAARLAQSPA
ncbi:hypothetical protein LBMAG48_12840 [Phycisphaerae bacterium]|nr:hypothetical protein LBMAG48_12840 [Phycisphaerae bacterium]